MTIIARYIVTHYLKVFGLCMGSATGLFLTVDFFERIGNFAYHGARTGAMLAYFAFKLPTMMTEVYPAVALLSVLISLGLLVRHREILALRACGIGTWQLAAPLLVASALISVSVLAWNEFVVPPTAKRSADINDLVIKKKQRRGWFNAQSLWYQGPEGFFNVDYFDANRKAVYGLTVYETDPSFRINRIIEVAEALWRNDRWELSGGTVKNLGPNGEVLVRPLVAGEFVLADTPDDFSQKKRHSQAFSYRDLKTRIEVLQDKGIDANELLVDLHFKLAVPFSGLISVLVGFPLAVRGGKRAGIGYGIMLGMVIGFAYWVTMAVAVSAGKTGGLSPIVAAWAANGLFAVVAGVLYLESPG